MPPSAARPQPQSALIVGAGIVGSAIAYRLSKAGIAVTVLDSAGPAAGASGGSWAWLNAAADAGSTDYGALRRAGLDAWHALDQELAGALPLDWHGAVLWDPALLQGVAGTRPGLRRLDAAAVRAEVPELANPPAEALLSPEDGLLDGAAAAACLIDAARAAGARLIAGPKARALLLDGTDIAGVTTETGPIGADITILVAGTGTSDLLATAGLPLAMANRPGVLVTTAPVPIRLGRALWGDPVHIKQDRQGRLVIGENAHAPGALQDLAALTESMLSRARAMLPGAGPLTAERVSLATRPIPADGFPAIGAPAGRGGLYIAVMHSGMTLAAVTARLAEQEILTGTEAPLLAPFRPDRFEEETAP
jgi:glycine/D-amino acid oxidase-like deaminating enzyme